MEARTLRTMVLAVMISAGASGCSGGDGNGGGSEAQPAPTPAQSVPESDPAGVGGTSNQ